jgi:hypothetical protein
METRVGAQPHMSGWDYADPYEDPYAPAPHKGYGAAAGFPRDDYPDLRPARTRDDLTNQEWPQLEATVREQGMWPYIRGHCPDGQLSADGICRALRDGLDSANYYRELVVKMRAERDEG